MQPDPRALRKGLKETPSLAWLYKMFAMLKSMFADLPELEGFEAPTPEGPQIFRVVAWTTAHEQADRAFRTIPNLSIDEISLYRERLRSDDEIVILGHRESEDPEDVDLLISVMSEEHTPGAALTLMGPGVGLRLNRRARRAARARVRRAMRRERRAIATRGSS